MIFKTHYATYLSQKLPEGKSGEFSITKMVIPKGTVARTYSQVGMFHRDEFSTDFPVVVLTEEGNGVWMSDSPMEQESLRLTVTAARGNVLIVGLGIGLLTTLIKPNNKMVHTITIIEKEQDVADLVYKHIKTNRTSLIMGDAKEYLSTTDDRYDFIYIDIWQGIMGPIVEGEQWVALASRCLKEKGEVRWWLQELHERVKSKLPKEPIGKAFLVVGDPCLICGKMYRWDYAGLCMDCADMLEVSEMYVKRGDDRV